MQGRILRSIWCLFCLLPTSILLAAEPPDGERLAELAGVEADASLGLYRELLSIPNDAHFPEQVERNVSWCEKAFGERGFETRRLATGGPPLLLAKRSVAEPERTVLVYLQLDGQPVAPEAWRQESPWKPVLKERLEEGWREIPWQRLEQGLDPEWRIFARSASDAKGPVAMFLAALDVLATEGWEPSFDLEVIMDFEEELGSPHLPAAVARHRQAFAADMLVIFDGPRHISNRPTLTFGARGIATITLRVFGPRRPQHSGHYGNYVPNPAQRLATLLASLEDDAGRVTIAGFYDGVDLDEIVRRRLAEVPDDEPAMRRTLGIATADGVAETYQEALQFPSLNVRGLAAGWVGNEARTIIPASAVAEIDLRLTLESDAERLIGLLRDHVEAQGFHLVEGEPSEAERLRHAKLASFDYEVSYGAFRTPLDSEVGRWLGLAMTRAFGEEPIRFRTSGGSIPISPFIQTLGIPAVTVPTVNRDNNQHSPNENLRLGNYVDGIRTFLAILTQRFEAVK